MRSSHRVATALVLLGLVCSIASTGLSSSAGGQDSVQQVVPEAGAPASGGSGPDSESYLDDLSAQRLEAEYGVSPDDARTQVANQDAVASASAAAQKAIPESAWAGSIIDHTDGGRLIIQTTGDPSVVPHLDVPYAVDSVKYSETDLERIQGELLAEVNASKEAIAPNLNLELDKVVMNPLRLASPKAAGVAALLAKAYGDAVIVGPQLTGQDMSCNPPTSGAALPCVEESPSEPMTTMGRPLRPRAPLASSRRTPVGRPWSLLRATASTRQRTTPGGTPG